jgi:DNA replication protein DnaC
MTGQAGGGQTILACALGHAACRQVRRGCSMPLHPILGKLLVARLEHT